MKKLFSFVATLSLLINSLFTPVYALAQSVDEVPSPTPVDTVIEPTATPTETPIETPTATPTEVSTPTPTPTTTEEPTSLPTDQPVETNAPESSPTVQGPPSSDSPAAQPTTIPSDSPTVETENLQLSAIVLENKTLDPSVINEFDLTYQEDGSASISTDKLDYSPTDTAVISGIGFENNKTYTIHITSTDEPAVNFSDSLTSNDKGEIIYSYTLDGNYRPNYQVEVKDGDRVVAKTAFTDGGWISGTVYNDLNNNGNRDFHYWLIFKIWDEPGMQSITINLDRNSDGSIDKTVTTNNDGDYTFSNLAGGTYRVRQVIPGGYIQTTADPSNKNINILSWGHSNVDFGNAVQPDITPPNTTPSVYSATYTWGDWTNLQKTIELTCSDGSGSGCKETYYCVDSTNTCSPTTIYSDKFNVNTEGVNYVRFYSKDNANVSETVKSVQVKIDYTNPTITLTGDNPQTVELGGTYTELGAIVSDGLSGPGALVIDSSSVNSSSVGTYTVYYNAKDVAGNNATTLNRTVNVVDTTAPTKPVINTPSNGDYFNITPITASWSTSFDLSGIAKYQVGYVYDDHHTFSGSTCTDLTFGGCRDVDGITTSRGHVPNTNEQGGITIYVRAIDGQDNVGPWSNPVYYIYDSTPPSAPGLESPIDGWATKGVAFSQKWYPVSDAVLYEYQSCNVNPGDAGEPCANVKYSATYTGTTKNVGAGQPDSHFWWRVKAKDAAGNWSGWSESRELIIDNTIPTGSWVNPLDGDTVSGVIELDFEAQDNLSGVATKVYQYKSDDGIDTFHDIIGNSWDTTALPLGDYIVRAIVTDNAGNVAEFDITVGVAAVISSQNAVGTTTNSILVTWTTDRPTTSRVVYDTINHPTLGVGDNYGYAFSTVEDTNKVTSHSVTLTGLATGATYYYRVISHGSPTAVGGEGYAITLTNAGPPESPSGVSGGVLGASTILANTFPQLAYVSGGTGETTEEITSDGSEQGPEPEVLGVNYETSQSGFFGWIMSNKVLFSGILLFVLLLAFLIFKRKKDRE